MHHGNRINQAKLSHGARSCGYSRRRGGAGRLRSGGQRFRGGHGQWRQGGGRKRGGRERHRVHRGIVRQPAGYRLPPEHHGFQHALLADQDRLHRVEPSHDQVRRRIGDVSGRPHRGILPVLRQYGEGRRRSSSGSRANWDPLSPGTEAAPMRRLLQAFGRRSARSTARRSACNGRTWAAMWPSFRSTTS